MVAVGKYRRLKMMSLLTFLKIETHGLDTPPYEHFTVCPHCGGAFVEAHRCDCCGEFITADYIMVQDGKCYCEECYSIRNIEDDLAA